MQQRDKPRIDRVPRRQDRDRKAPISHLDIRRTKRRQNSAKQQLHNQAQVIRERHELVHAFAFATSEDHIAVEAVGELANIEGGGEYLLIFSKGADGMANLHTLLGAELADVEAGFRVWPASNGLRVKGLDRDAVVGLVRCFMSEGDCGGVR